MTSATLIRFLLLVSMGLLVFALGLRSTPRHAGFLLREPRLLARSLIAMYVVMPLVVIGVLLHLHLQPPVKIALAALSLSPVPPFLPGKQLKLASCEDYIFGLLVTASVFAVVWVPVVTSALAAHWALGPHVTVAAVLRIVVLTILLPLGAGMFARRLLAERAPRWGRVCSAAGGVLLVLAFVPVLVSQWGSVRSLIGNGTLLAIIGFTCVGLLIGHVLGGPDPQQRTVLALATASRHPAVALAIASAGFPQQRLAPAAVLLAVLVSVIAAAPYTSWRRKAYAAGLRDTGAAQPRGGPEPPSRRSAT
jgi:BASS family bile acid:Na+ symporter